MDTKPICAAARAAHVQMVRSRVMAGLALVAALAACDSDSSEPVGPGEHEITLESEELLSGGTGVLASHGFVGLELEPALDADGVVIPDRWSNLSVTVRGIDTDVRRLDERRMEFAVPTMAGGATVGVDVSSPRAHGSLSAPVLGVIASRQVVPCFIGPNVVGLIPAGDILVFDTQCQAHFTFEHLRQGVGATWPTLPDRGFEWVPEGEVPEAAPWAFAGPSPRPAHFVARRSFAPDDFWVWEAGTEPHPVQALSCFGAAEVDSTFVAPAEVGDGACLLIAPESGVILKDGEPVAEWPRFQLGHFVMSDDGWLTARNTSRLLVFDPAGELMVAADVGLIRDARFAPGGGPLYVATEDRITVVDRRTGETLRETAVTGAANAVAVSDDRLWVARTTDREELFVERLDPETLELERSIAVSQDLAADLGFTWPYHGVTPVLLEDPTGTRVSYTGRPADFAGLWSHVIEVE